MKNKKIIRKLPLLYKENTKYSNYKLRMKQILVYVQVMLNIRQT